ncbi:MAG: ECF transporter S component [Lachnospiraceae bacterium]|nr:ECF transporter S component [Lachnospiraceae bacterium]
MNKNKFFTTKNLAIMGMLGALAGVLTLFSFPIAFIAPSFYKLDFAEIPVLVGTFLLGPIAGVVIELLKILVNLLLNSSTTFGVGELANFSIGCALVVPAGIVYQLRKNKKGAILGMAVGTVIMVAAGVFLNAYVMLPFYSSFMPLESILEAGAAINPAISNVWTFCLIAVAPFNLIKGVVVSLVTAVIYKKISILLKGNH